MRVFLVIFSVCTLTLWNNVVSAQAYADNTWSGSGGNSSVLRIFDNEKSPHLPISTAEKVSLPEVKDKFILYSSSEMPASKQGALVFEWDHVPGVDGNGEWGYCVGTIVASRPWKWATINLWDYDYISFMIKGSSGGEDFEISFKDKNGGTSEINYKGLKLSTMVRVTAEWTKVIIPLSAFDRMERRMDPRYTSEIAFKAVKGGKTKFFVDHLMFININKNDYNTYTNSIKEHLQERLDQLNRYLLTSLEKKVDPKKLSDISSPDNLPLSRKISNLTFSQQQLTQYSPFNISFNLSLNEALNPFNPNHIRVDLLILKGNTMAEQFPGFFDGNSHWQIRYTPIDKGDYKAYIIINDGEISRSEQIPFSVKASNKPGFVRVSTQDNHYFETMDGKPFWLNGMNLGWTGNYELYFKKMSEAGQNYIRSWMVEWNLPLEWNTENVGYLYQYSLENARKIDNIMKAAEKYGIYIQWMFSSFDDYKDFWTNNPYNKANGGPAADPLDFFKNDTAKEVYNGRLRYIIARWGYSANVFAWEFFNEIHWILGDNSKIGAEWVDEKAKYLKEIDPKHMVTSSAGDHKEVELWKSDAVDFIALHAYVGDPPSVLTLYPDEVYNRFNKPTFFNELGISQQSGTVEAQNDPTGITLHKTLWSSVMSRQPGTACYWWWDTLIEEKNLYYHFKAVSDYVKGIPWTTASFKPADIKTLEVPNAKNITFTASPGIGWGTSEEKEFNVMREGYVKGFEKFSVYIQSENHKEMMVWPIFHVDYPEQGEFILRVQQVAAWGANCKILLDGKEVVSKSWPTSKSDAAVDETLKVTVPKGKHEIQIINDGGDWLLIKDVTFTNYAQPVKAIGNMNDSLALVYVSNNGYTIKNQKPDMVSGAKIDIRGLKDSGFTVEFWDTFTGKVLSTASLQSKGGSMLVSLPDFDKDIAIKAIATGTLLTMN